VSAIKNQVHFEVWSDYVCPFCYLELPVLNRIAEAYQGYVIVHWRAFELRPEPIPTLDPDGEYLHAIWNRAVYPTARQRGMKLRLPPIQPRSRRAFEAAEFARTKGAFAKMHEALFRAFFQEGRDLNSLAVLLQVGSSVGLDPTELQSALETGECSAKVLQDEKLAYALGITGVPTIVVSHPGTTFEIDCVLSGAQPYESVQAGLERLLAAA